MNTKPSFSIHKLYKSYRRQPVLVDFSCDIYPNEITCFLGPNGVGKTTLLKLLISIEKAKSGDIYFFEKKLNFTNVAYRNELGIVLNTKTLIEDFSIKDHLLFTGKFQFVDKNTLNERIDKLTTLFDLKQYGNKKIQELSDGNKIKVLLCSALIHNPKVLILDEPFIYLDQSSIEKITLILLKLKKKKTIIITSHNLEIIEKIGDRFIMINKDHTITESHNIKELNLKKEDKQKNISSELDWLQ